MSSLFIRFGCLVAVTVAVQVVQAQGIVMDAPINGWRNSQGMAENYTQRVHYPASSVNVRPNQAASAMIAGHIASNVKVIDPNARQRRNTGDRLATLIVNGVPMPLAVSSDGRFARQYSFSKGSNSVEVRYNGEVSRTQFYESYATKTSPKLRIVLSWDQDNTDVDLHVVAPDGEHVFYGNRVGGEGGALDVDVTSGYGPEIYSNPTPIPGNYLVFLNYYGGRYDNDTPEDASFGSNGTIQPVLLANVTVITDENTPREKQASYMIPLRHPGELTLVKSILVN